VSDVTDLTLPRAHTKVDDLVLLTKVRLNALVVATTAGGYYMAAPASVDLASLLVTCLGTALVASGASAFNQVDERDLDRLMVRTRLRPLADGRMGAGEGRAIAAIFAVAGLLILWFGTNATAALVALATLLSYTVIYTPLKRRSSLATVVGAVPGALPPLIGWCAASGDAGVVTASALAHPAPWSLFLLMFLWQLPHFLAIAWMYRDDYARANLPMLPVVDTDGQMTGRQAVLWAATLIPISELPFLLNLTGPVYAVSALVLGLGLLALACRFLIRRTNENARTLFLGSIIYLPLLWIVMVAGRT
jgi:protoheme IX farnesyltransferase